MTNLTRSDGPKKDMEGGYFHYLPIAGILQILNHFEEYHMHRQWVISVFNKLSLYTMAVLTCLSH